MHHQLPYHRTPLTRVELGADAEGAERVMSVLHDLRRALADQHIDHMLRSEVISARLPAAVNARQNLLRGLRAIPHFRRQQTIVTVAADPDGFAEIVEQPHAPAFGGLTE